MLSKKIRQTQRFQEIMNAFIRNGFRYFLIRLGLTERATTPNVDEHEMNMNMHTIGERLRDALQELGPTFIKLGQIASARQDLIPQEIAMQLAKLQDEVSPFTYEEVRDIIEQELGDPPEKLYQHFNKTPLATASIGQVHTAILPTGEKVAVKIQRPNIHQTVETDLEILDNIARIMEAKFAWAKSYNIRQMISEFAHSLRDELDYTTEGRNCDRIQKQFENDETIHIPKVYWAFSTKKVLTVELIEGIKVNHLVRLDDEGYNRNIIAERVAQSMLHQILIEGFFHGDPHPGNIYVLPGNIVSYLDFGMVGRLNEELRSHFASLVIGLQRGNTKMIIKTFAAMDILSDETDIGSLHHELDGVITKYYDTALSEVSLGKVISEIVSIAYRHDIKIPAEITMLAKAIVTVEAIIEELDPQFSIMKAAEPFGQKLVRNRFHPKRILRDSWDSLLENVEMAADLPKNLKELSMMLRKGKLHFNIHVPELQVFLQRLDKISNRLSFSIILLAFSILMVGLIIGAAIAGQTNVLWQLPVIEIGSIVATLMFLFMIYSIFKSGRM